MSAESASTIESGHIIVHFRSDRAVHASNYRRYTPLQLDCTSLDAKVPIEATLDDIDTSLTDSQTANQDMRVHAYSERSFPAGTRTWRIPATQRRFIALHSWLVASPGITAEWEVFDEAAASKYLTSNVPAGAANPPTYDSDSSVQTQTFDEPENDARDWVITLTVAGGTAELAYCVLYST